MQSVIQMIITYVFVKLATPTHIFYAESEGLFLESEEYSEKIEHYDVHMFSRNG